MALSANFATKIAENVYIIISELCTEPIVYIILVPWTGPSGPGPRFGCFAYLGPSGQVTFLVLDLQVENDSLSYLEQLLSCSIYYFPPKI